MSRASRTAEEPGPASVIGHVTSKDGTSIGYERSGSGSPLVLVHGTSADRTRWASVLPAFQEQFTVYAVDRRGRGLSGDRAPWSLDREFEDIAAVVASIHGPVDVLGHSFGALCAMEGALRVSNVRRLVLYEPAFRTDLPLYEDDARGRLQALIDSGDREAALTTFLCDFAGLSESALAAMRASPSWNDRLAIVHTVPRELAEGDYVLDVRKFQVLSAPVLLLSGAESGAELHAATRVAHDALPNSRVTVMPDQGHLAIVAAPDLFQRLVIDFLTEAD